MAGECGIVLYPEHLTRTTTNLTVTVAQLARFVQDVDSPHLAGMADLDMMGREGERLSDYVQAFRALPSHIHLVDGMPGGHLAPGDGVLPLTEEIAYLRAAGYRGYLTLEVMHDRYLEQPAAAMEKCAAWLDRHGIPYRNNN